MFADTNQTVLMAGTDNMTSAVDLNMTALHVNGSFKNITRGTDYEYPIVTDPPLTELISVSIVYGITLVLGIVGNILVIFSVTRYPQMMTVTNTFLLSLASADLLLIIICVPVKVGRPFCNYCHMYVFCKMHDSVPSLNSES